MTQTSLGLVILLPQTPPCWDYIYVSPHPTHFFKVDLSFPLRADYRHLPDAVFLALFHMTRLPDNTNLPRQSRRWRATLRTRT